MRITRSGEYIHSAPWNGLIGRDAARRTAAPTCFPDAAKWFYNFARVGDVVTYADTGGQRMPALGRLRRLERPVAEWAQGGLLLNH